MSEHIRREAYLSLRAALFTLTYVSFAHGGWVLGKEIAEDLNEANTSKWADYIKTTQKEPSFTR